MPDHRRECWCCGYDLGLEPDEDGRMVCEHCGASPAQSLGVSRRMLLAASSAYYEGCGAPIGSLGWHLATIATVDGGVA